MFSVILASWASEDIPTYIACSWVGENVEEDTEVAFLTATSVEGALGLASRMLTGEVGHPSGCNGEMWGESGDRWILYSTLVKEADELEQDEHDAEEALNFLIRTWSCRISME